MKINLDPKNLTLGDMEDFEDAAGVDLLDTLTKMEKNGSTAGLRIKTVRALVWVCVRKNDPDYTFEDARAIVLEDLEIDVGGNGADPTPGGD